MVPSALLLLLATSPGETQTCSGECGIKREPDSSGSVRVLNREASSQVPVSPTRPSAPSPPKRPESCSLLVVRTSPGTREELGVSPHATPRVTLSAVFLHRPVPTCTRRVLVHPVGYLDDTQFVRFNSAGESARYELRASWVEQEGPEYWQKETEIVTSNAQFFPGNLQTMLDYYNLSHDGE